MTDDPTDRIVQEIVASRVPAERLSEVAEAITFRSLEDVAWRWRLRLDLAGREFVIDQDEYPLGALVKAEKRLGKTWFGMNPASSAHDASALIVEWLVAVEGFDPAEAEALVERIPYGDIEKAVERYTREAGPFDGSGPSTG